MSTITVSAVSEEEALCHLRAEKQKAKTPQRLALLDDTFLCVEQTEVVPLWVSLEIHLKHNDPQIYHASVRFSFDDNECLVLSGEENHE